MQEKHFLALSPHGFHRVAYTQWGGDDAASTVICVHGLTRNSRDFDTLADALCDRYRVICPDMPGRGKSERLMHAADYQYPVYLQTCAALIAHLNVESVIWLGTSMGGLIGMLLAAQPASPIARLIINDVGAIVPGGALKRIAGYVGRTGPFSTLEELEQRLRTVHAAFGKLTDHQWRHLATHSNWRDGEGRLWLAYDPAIAESIVAESYPDVDLSPVWGALTCPTLILRGDESDVLPAAVLEGMAAVHPDCRTVTFTGVGHAPALMTEDQIGPIKEWLCETS